MSHITYNLAKNEDGSVVTIYGLDSGIKVVRDDAAHFGEVVAELTNSTILGESPNAEALEALIAPAEQAALRFEQLTDRVAIRHNRLYYDGDEIHGGLADQVLSFLEEGEDFMPLVNFYEKLMANPQAHSREQAYRWLTSQRLTITEDGDVLGYKGCVSTGDERVRQSTHSGHAIVNGVEVRGHTHYPDGAVVTMPRSEVDHDPYSACSTGLHVGTYSYARAYGDHVIEVLIDPRDIVSVPAGEDEKMRVSRLKVLGVAEAKDEDLVRILTIDPYAFEDDYDDLEEDHDLWATEDDDYYGDGDDEEYDDPAEASEVLVPNYGLAGGFLRSSINPVEFTIHYYTPEPEEAAEEPTEAPEPDSTSTGTVPSQAMFEDAVRRAKRRRQNLPKWIRRVLKWEQVPGTDGKSAQDWRLP